MPDIDGATFAALLITYGVEIGTEVGPVTRTGMADYLRAVADALDTGELLPWLSGIPPAEEEPPF